MHSSSVPLMGVVSIEQMVRGSSLLLAGASPLAHSPGSQGQNRLVKALSVGIMRSVCHAPRSLHSDFSEVLHRSLISWHVV